MRKINALIFTAALLFGLNLSAQDHHWPLSTDANDAVGTLHGTMHGITFTTDAERGDVAVFDGSAGDSYIELPSLLNGQTEMTISLWFKQNTDSVWARLYSFGVGDFAADRGQACSNHLTLVGSNPGGWHEFRIKHPDNLCDWYAWPGQPRKIIEGEWHHSVVTLTETMINVYVDGEKIAQQSTKANPFDMDDIGNVLGRSYWDEPDVNANMSDLKIYNRVLTDIEVAELYAETEKSTDQIEGGFAINNIATETANIDVVLNAPGKVHFTAKAQHEAPPPISELVDFPYKIDVTAANTVANFEITALFGGTPKTYYSFYFIAEDASGNLQDTTTRVDFKTLAETDEFYHWPLASDAVEIEAGLNGEVDGIEFSDDPVRGGVATFDNDTGYVKLPQFIGGLDEVTISIWFRMDEKRVWSRLINLGEGPRPDADWWRDGFWLVPASHWNDSQPFGLEATGKQCHWNKGVANPDLILGAWYQTTIVVSNEIGKIYLNDTEIVSMVMPKPIGEINDIQNSLGTSFWPDPIFRGAMSDLFIYSKALTAEEVTTLYNDTKKEAPTVPGFVASYPAVSNIATTSATLEVQLDAAGVAYYEVKEAAEAAPTAADLVTADVKIDVADANTTATADLAGLTAGTDYKAYVVAGLAGGAAQETVTEVAFSTLPVGIGQSGIENCEIYPNPTKGIVTISSGAKISTIEVYSISGSRMISLINDQSSEISIDLNEFANGIYLLHLKAEDGAAKISKIVKQ
ncbi:MAG: LamG-like jellyroll fold domain-containing protein [Bacteroidota bacterium]